MKVLTLIIILIITPLHLMAAINQQQFDTVLREMRDEYTSALRAEGLRFVLDSRWNENRLLAHIKIPRGKAILTVSGGYARQKEMTADAFRIVLCHEIGHILGGAPKQSNGHWASIEGQADYFATAKCIKKIIPINQNQKERVLSAALTLGKLSAIQNGDDPSQISLTNKDKREVQQTSTLHPDPQCRLDTMVAGYLCPVSENEDFSTKDPSQGACLHQSSDPEIRMGARPLCWYRPPTTHLRCTSQVKLPYYNSKISVMTMTLDKRREDHTIEVKSMVGVALPVNNNITRAQSDTTLSIIESDRLKLTQNAKNQYKLSIEKELFDQLKEKSLIRVDWSKLSLNYDDTKRILFKMNCSAF